MNPRAGRTQLVGTLTPLEGALLVVNASRERLLKSGRLFLDTFNDKMTFICFRGVRAKH